MEEDCGLEEEKGRMTAVVTISFHQNLIEKRLIKARAIFSTEQRMRNRQS